MFKSSVHFRRVCLVGCTLGLSLSLGCISAHHRVPAGTVSEGLLPNAPMPRELDKAVLPPYVIEPPDILTIECLHIVPHPPYRLRTDDVVYLRVQETGSDYRIKTGDRMSLHVEGTVPDAPINGECSVEADGTVNLDEIRFRFGFGDPRDRGAERVDTGPRYGSVRVAGLTREDARTAIEEHLKKTEKEPRVALSLITPGEIAGRYRVDPDGTINLNTPLKASAMNPNSVVVSVPEDDPGERLPPGDGAPSSPVTRYHKVQVARFDDGRPSLSTDEAQEAIERELKKQGWLEPRATVSLIRMALLQQIQGEHLVTPDGTVTLGAYGSVSVVGKTLADAKRAIESHLARYHLEDPEVAVDVYAYNSKAFYVIYQGAGTGDSVYKFPVTGNDTVLDAVSKLEGLRAISSLRIWVARPTPNGTHVQVLPVDWEAVVAQGAVATNYQLMPGDRLFVAEDKWIALDTSLAKVFAPMERVMGFAFQGVQTVSRFSGKVLSGGGLQGYFGGIQ